MDVFLRVEIAARELDSKILLALVAAGRGHRVLVCDTPTLMRRIFRRPRGPRFVHTKDLVPFKPNYHFLRIFRAAGCYVSSLDEESGAMWSSFSDFADSRYGYSTVSAVDAVFCWGERDYRALVSRFPESRAKIHKTGSPRVELWRPKFSPVYLSAVRGGSNPFVLVASAIGGPLTYRILHEAIQEARFYKTPASGAWKVERDALSEYRDAASVLIRYLDLIRFLSERNSGYDILVKPHPIENPLAWKVLLEGISGVAVTVAPTSDLIRQSKALVTSVSTTAVEAVFAGTPFVNFAGYDTPIRAIDFVGSLGVEANSKEKVAKALDELVTSDDGIGSRGGPKGSRHITRRFYSTVSGSAAERIVDVWEHTVKIGQEQKVSPSVRLDLLDFRYWLSSAFPAVAPIVSQLLRLPRLSKSKMVKYPPLDRGLETEKIAKMQEILGIKEAVRYRFVGKRSILFEPDINGN